MTHVYQPHAGGFAYFTSGVINGAIGVGGTWTAYSTLTLPAYTLGGTVTSNGQSFSGTIANLGTVTTVDLNGGTIDGTIIGGAVPAAGTFTTAAATTGNITTVNATTVDATNIEVTNLKAKDGTAAGSIADATGVVTLGSSVLTTTDINGGTIDGVALGGASAVSLGTPSSGTLTNCTGLPVSTGISGLAANVATFLATPSSANLASAVTDETGSGALVFATSPSFTTPTINTAASVGGSWTAAAAWTLPAFTLGGTVTSNGQSFSGTIANLGTVTTADINGGTIDGTVIGATTPAAGTFTTLVSNAKLGVGKAPGAQVDILNNADATAYALNIDFYETAVFKSSLICGWSTGSDFSYFGNYQNYPFSIISNNAVVATFTSTGLNSTVIGATTPAAGTFTDLTSTGNTVLGNASTDTLNVGNGGIIKDSSGRVGIGVTPSYKLDVYGANVISAIRASSGFGLQLINGATGSFAAVAFQINNTETARISSSADNIIFGTGSAATTRATLNSTGLGIGVTPSYKLATATGLTWAAQAASNNAAEVHKVGIRAPTDGVDDSRADIRFGTTVGSGGSDSYIAFWTNTYGVAYAERMLIDKSGNVGIGVTPSYKLHVGSGQIAAPDGSAAAPTYSFASSGNADTGIYLPASNEVAVAGAGAMLTTFKTDRLTFASGYHVTTATATGTTPAIQSGTYTPTYTETGTNNITGTVTHVKAHWERVGNIITVHGKAIVESLNTTTTQFTVTLPITSTLTNDLFGFCFAVSGANRSAGWVTESGNNALVNYNGTAATSQDVYYEFSYEAL